MKIIISPAKEMSLEKPYAQDVNFNKLTLDIIDELSALSEDDLQRILKLSHKQIKVNKEYISGFNNSPSYKAIYMYNGLAYRNIGIDEMGKEDREYLQENLIILSALYGPIKPFSFIKPYRLDFNTFLKVKGKNLKKYWADYYLDFFKNEDLILNLASKEFSNLLSNHNGKIINFEFYKNNKQHSTISKKARGRMVAYLCTEKIKDIEKIKEFNWDGYKYISEFSETNKFVFSSI